FAEIMDGIFEAAEEFEYRLLIGTGRREAAGERRAVDVLLEHRADGLLLVSPRLPVGVILAIGRSTPTVVVGRPIRAGPVDSVTTDDHAGGKLAVRHLAELGHSRITHIDGGRGAGSSARRAGYVKEMAALGLEPRVVSAEFTEAAGVSAVERLLAAGELPTA